jgi:hypothetical protein
MIDKLTAISAAVVCAGLMVAFVPGFAPTVAAKAPAGGTTNALAAADQSIRNSNRVNSLTCQNAWPYYEHSCLRDRRQVDGIGRAVRVVAADRIANTIGYKISTQIH